MKMEFLLSGLVLNGPAFLFREKVEVGVCVLVSCGFRVEGGEEGAFKLPELCAKDLHYQI